MTESAKEILYYMLSVYFIWAGITALMIYNKIQTIKFEAEYMANCEVVDQYGSCYTTKEYQELLEREEEYKKRCPPFKINYRCL